MKLAACCCYFNFAGGAARLRNYLRFRQAVEREDIELLTVELVPPDPAADDGWAPEGDLAHLPGVVNVVGDVMWQKERLWQLGGELLVRRGYDAVAFIDADTIFAQPSWPRVIARALERNVVVQAFETIDHVFSDRTLRQKSSLAQRKFRPASGGAFAARAEFIRRPGFYQHCVVGSGDGALTLALLRSIMHPDYFRLRVARARFLASDAMAAHWLRWADSARAAVAGRWGHAPLHVCTLPHGALRDRRYGPRNQLLAGFDPDRDVRVGGGAFWWASDKPDLARGVADYFARRREDAPPDSAATPAA